MYTLCSCHDRSEHFFFQMHINWKSLPHIGESFDEVKIPGGWEDTPLTRRMFGEDAVFEIVVWYKSWQHEPLILLV